MGWYVLAEVLGIDEPPDEWALVEVTRRGLPGGSIDVLAKTLGLTISELSSFLHVSSRTLMRHRGRLLAKCLSDRLLCIGIVIARCIEFFQSHEKATRWLKSPLLALGNIRPLDLLDTNRNQHGPQFTWED